MISIALGLLTTGWSLVRSSKILQYALIAGAVVLGILLYGRGKKKQGAAHAIAHAIEKVVKRMERSREIHAEIRRLPLSDRARRLRDLDAARR